MSRLHTSLCFPHFQKASRCSQSLKSRDESMTDFSKEAESREMEGTHGLQRPRRRAAVAHNTTRVQGRYHHPVSAGRKAWPRLAHTSRPSVSRVQFCRPPGRGRLSDRGFNFLNIKACHNEAGLSRRRRWSNRASMVVVLLSETRLIAALLGRGEGREAGKAAER